MRGAFGGSAASFSPLSVERSKFRPIQSHSMLCEVIVSFESPCCQARLAGSSAGGCRQRDSSRSLHSEVSEIVFDEPANSLALGVALTSEYLTQVLVVAFAELEFDEYAAAVSGVSEQVETDVALCEF